jgi:HAD superfamily hydrolase (TIGR01484 family)
MEKDKKAIIFDLDGTLAESKQSLDNEMSGLLYSLMQNHIVGVMSGGSFTQYQKQFVPFVKEGSDLNNLVLLPTSGASMYLYKNNSWELVYEEKISEEDFENIKNILELSIERNNLLPEEKYGQLIEYRGTQITYSGLGQDAPLSLKEVWDPDQIKRKRVVSDIEKDLPDFEIRIGGTTSVDINRKGIDKAYGVKMVSETFNISISDILYVGDALYEGGNDSAVIKSGVDTHAVKNVAETKDFIRSIVS